MTSAAQDIENLVTQGEGNSCDDIMVGEEDAHEEEQVKIEQKKDVASKRLVNPILYTRGVPSQDFYLILSGKVVVCSGNEGFMVEQS